VPVLRTGLRRRSPSKSLETVNDFPGWYCWSEASTQAIDIDVLTSLRMSWWTPDVDNSVK